MHGRCTNSECVRFLGSARSQSNPAHLNPSPPQSNPPSPNSIAPHPPSSNPPLHPQANPIAQLGSIKVQFHRLRRRDQSPPPPPRAEGTFFSPHSQPFTSYSLAHLPIQHPNSHSAHFICCCSRISPAGAAAGAAGAAGAATRSRAALGHGCAREQPFQPADDSASGSTCKSCRAPCLFIGQPDFCVDRSVGRSVGRSFG